MLSLISPVEAAPPTRALIRTGTSFLCGRVAVPGARSVEAAIGRPAGAKVVFPRPRPQASTGFVPSANATHAAGQAAFAQKRTIQSQPTQRQSSQKYAHTTRLATADGGGVGPHPARDPV